jgi:hypothetical protein
MSELAFGSLVVLFSGRYPGSPIQGKSRVDVRSKTTIRDGAKSRLDEIDMLPILNETDSQFRQAS